MSIILKRALMLGALVAVSLPALAFAVDGPYASYDVKVESTAVDTEVTPTGTFPITKDKVQFHIINNTGKVLYFSDGKEQSYIPVVSNSTVTTAYNAGQEYKVTDDQGVTVAKWNLDNRKVGVPNVTSASQSQFSQWSTSLQQVIENQKVSYQEPPAKPEPHYYTSTPAAHTSGVVRGYW
jgi:hypothetical protein